MLAQRRSHGPSLYRDRSLLWLAALLAVLLAASVLLAQLTARQQPVALHVDSQMYQGVGNCWLVADIYSDALASSGTNRLMITHTEECPLCTEAWAVHRSPSYRVRVLVRPCSLASPFARS